MRGKINREYLTILRQEQISTHTTAVFALKLSNRVCSRLRIRMHCKYVKNRPKRHVDKLENYVCDKEVVKRALEAAAGGCRELGTSMTTLMDLLQILQEYAKTLGYTITVDVIDGQHSSELMV